MATVTVGDFEVSLVRHSLHWWDGGAFFGVVPKTLWSRKIEPDELNRIPLGFNCYLIRTEDHTILVETGEGDKQDARARERMGLPPESEPLPETIARHGFNPESIDIVINSHLHFDHCGGNTILGEGGARPAFPRARYFASRGEWEHAHERLPRDSVSYIDANYDPLVNTGQMTLVDGDCEVVPGVWMRRAPRAQPRHDGDHRGKRGPDVLLLFRPGAHHGAHAAHLGDGVRPVPARNNSEQDPVARRRGKGRLGVRVCARQFGGLREDCRESENDVLRRAPVKPKVKIQRSINGGAAAHLLAFDF